MSPPSCSIRNPYRLHGSSPVPQPLPPLPHCQHEAGRCVIAPLSNSSWVLVSEWGFVGSGDLRQMSEYPIPHGEQYHSCILRGSCKSTFLHPKEKIQGLIDLPQGWWEKCSQDCFPSPNKGANQTSSAEKACESMTMRKNNLIQVKMYIKTPAFTWAASYWFPCSIALPLSLINPTSYIGFGSSFSGLMSQFPGLWRQEPLTPACNTSHWHVTVCKHCYPTLLP
jgi:hypothetical protein